VFVEPLAPIVGGQRGEKVERALREVSACHGFPCFR
jgi:hypothetical protein